MLKCIVLILVLTLVAVECRSADNLQELKAKAEQGDASAQYRLGAMFATGQSVPQDYAEALKWLRKAVD